MKKIIAFIISATMIMSLVCMVPISAETKTEGLVNNAPTQQDIISYMQEHKDEISKDYSVSYDKAFTKIEDASSYDVDDMGTLSEATQKKALARLNLMRYIAGEDPVSLNTDYEKKAQAIAYVNYLNNEMTHAPAQPTGASDKLYKLAKAGASYGNLSCGFPDSEESMNAMNPSEDVDNWLSDSGIKDVGHRCWCLNPKLEGVGFGRAGGTSKSGSSYELQGAMVYDRWPGSDASQTGIAWPATNMPYNYFKSSDAWSYISTSALDFNDVKVTLTLEESFASTPGKTWTMTATSSSDGEVYTVDKHDYNIGSDAVIFKPNNIQIHPGDVYNVKITGTNRTIDYDVNFFMPETTTKFSLDSSKLNSEGQLVLPEGTENYDLTDLVTIEPDSAKDQYIKVTSSDDDVATVSDMKLTAKSIGETELTLELLNGKKLTLPVKIVSNKAQLPTGPTLTYNGEEQNGLVLNDAIEHDDWIWGTQYTTTATDVGTYYYYVKPKDGYTWEDGTTYSKRVTWKIVKADNKTEKFDVTSPAYPEKPSVDVKLKYLDDEKTIEYKKADESDDAYDTDVPTTPGKYVVRVSCDGDENINDFEETKEFTIHKGTIDTDQIDMDDQTVTYDGEDHSGDITADNDNYNYTYTIEDSSGEKVDEAVDAGTYKVTAAIVKKENGSYYEEASKTATLMIKPAKVSLPDLTQEFTYDGKEHSICDSTDTIKVEDGTATDAGTYTATFSLKDDNHVWEDGTSDDQTKEFTIVPKKITLPEMKTELTYNGEKQSICDDIAGVKVTNGSATNVGDYKATLTVEDPKNTTFSDGKTSETVSYSIKKKQISLPELTTKMTYNGEEQAICETSKWLDITNRTATNAGEYTATFSLTDPENTEFSDGTTADKTRTYTIAKKAIALPELTTKMTYNGEEQAICETSKWLDITNRTATNAGEYTATFSLTDPENTEFSDGTTKDKTRTYTIAKKAIALPELTTKMTYNGEKQTICKETEGLTIENREATDAGTYTATFTPDKNHVWEDQSSGSKSADYTIEPKKIALPAMKTDLVYNGEAQKACDDVEGLTIEDGTATNAGTYQVKFKLTDAKNTCFSDGSTDPKKQSYTIAKKSVSMPDVKTSLTYNGASQSICEEVEGLSIENRSATEPGTYTATFKLKENYIWSNGTEEPKTVTYTVTKAAEPATPKTDNQTNTPSNTNSNTNSKVQTSNKAAQTTSQTTSPASHSTQASSSTQSAQTTFTNNVQQVTSTITNLKNDRDLANSRFGTIQLRAGKITNTSIVLKWKKVKNANSYLIYGNKCGSKYLYITKSTRTSNTQKKLKKGIYYKYLVIAINAQGKQIAASKLIHVATKGSKNANVKSIKVNKSRISLKKKKSFKLKIKVVKDNKTLRMHRRIAYESSNTKVATVSASGTIKAKAKGKATIYIYAQNGYYKTVSVTVK